MNVSIISTKYGWDINVSLLVTQRGGGTLYMYKPTCAPQAIFFLCTRQCAMTWVVGLRSPYQDYTVSKKIVSKSNAWCILIACNGTFYTSTIDKLAWRGKGEMGQNKYTPEDAWKGMGHFNQQQDLALTYIGSEVPGGWEIFWKRRFRSCIWRKIPLINYYYYYYYYKIDISYIIIQKKIYNKTFFLDTGVLGVENDFVYN